MRFTDPWACPLPAGTLLSENFESVGANNSTLNLPGWKNIGETGGVPFQAAVFGPVKSGKISAFLTGVSTVSSWLISPAVNLTGATAPKITFTHAEGYATGATSFQVLISTNYAGSNTPSTSTWSSQWQLIASTPTTGYSTFAPVTINIPPSYIGQTIYVAFKYDGGDPTKTTTYEIDDVKVLAL